METNLQKNGFPNKYIEREINNSVNKKILKIVTFTFESNSKFAYFYFF